MTKLISGLLAALLFLSGCFGNSAQPEVIPPNYKVYDHELYSFQYYLDWEILGTNDLADYPQGTLLALRNNVKEKNKFITNFTISKNTVPANTDAIAYGLQVKSQHSSTLINYNLEGEEKISTRQAGQDVPSLYIIFTGKLRPQGDTLRFFQKFVTKGTDGYILTIAAPLTEETLTLEKAKNSMKTFNLK